MREDINACLEKFNIKTFGNKKNIERAESMLWPDEKVLYITPANAVIYSVNVRKKDKLPGIFTVTDRRILFSFKAGFTEMDESFGLEEVEAVNSSGNGMTGGHITVHTKVKTIDVSVTSKKEILKEIQNLITVAVNARKNNAEIFPSDSREDDSLEQLEKLHNFLERGIITKEEFEIKKRQLLGL
ncbi:SHOCT domain-containing protein [Lachnospiraceae bacterium KK002]